MNPKQLAEQNYYKFCQLPGCEYIASEYALIKIITIIQRFKVNSVLEIGLGIGSIVDTVLKYSRLLNHTMNYSGTEENNFCLSELKKNVTYYFQIKIFNNLSEIDLNKKFDLVVVDGQDKFLSEVPNYCTPQAIIFIEGDRKPQLNLIMSLFPKAKHVQLISIRRNKNYSQGTPGYFIGGVHVIFTNPNLSTYVFWIREKIKTGIKRQMRKIK